MKNNWSKEIKITIAVAAIIVIISGSSCSQSPAPNKPVARISTEPTSEPINEPTVGPTREPAKMAIELAPDLWIDLQELEPVTPGNLVDVTFTAGNQGSEPVRGTNSAGSDGYVFDFILSTDRKVPDGPAIYTETYREDVLINRKSATSDLHPGEQETLVCGQCLIPGDTPAGSYFVCMQIVTAAAIAEKDTSNNVKCAALQIEALHGVKQVKNDPPWTGAWVHISPGGGMGQTFQAASTALQSIEVGITTGNPGSGTDTLTLKVLSENGNALAIQKQFVEDGFDGWLRFEWPKGLQVAQGENVTIMLEGTNRGTFGWKYISNTYPDGHAIFFEEPRSDQDFFFRINQ